MTKHTKDDIILISTVLGLITSIGLAALLSMHSFETGDIRRVWFVCAIAPIFSVLLAVGFYMLLVLCHGTFKDD